MSNTQKLSTREQYEIAYRNHRIGADHTISYETALKAFDELADIDPKINQAAWEHLQDRDMTPINNTAFCTRTTADIFEQYKKYYRLYGEACIFTSALLMSFERLSYISRKCCFVISMCAV